MNIGVAVPEANGSQEQRVRDPDAERSATVRAVDRRFRLEGLRPSESIVVPPAPIGGGLGGRHDRHTPTNSTRKMAKRIQTPPSDGSPWSASYAPAQAITNASSTTRTFAAGQPELTTLDGYVRVFRAHSPPGSWRCVGIGHAAVPAATPTMTPNPKAATAMQNT